MAAAATMYPSAPNLGYAFNTAPAATHTLLNTSALPSWAPAAHNGGWMPATAHCSKFVSPQPFLAFDELSAAQLEYGLGFDLPGAAGCLGNTGAHAAHRVGRHLCDHLGLGRAQTIMCLRGEHGARPL